MTTITVDEQWTAVALLFGPPRDMWRNSYTYEYAVPLSFRIAVDKVFGEACVQRVGLFRLTWDYAEWYHTHETTAPEAAAHPLPPHVITLEDS